MPNAMSEDELIFLAAAILLAPNHNIGTKAVVKNARELYAEVIKKEGRKSSDHD